MLKMIDIVIVNYNSTEHLLGCLDSIRKNIDGLNHKIYVHDNASDEDVEEILSGYPEIHLRINPQNLGFAKAVNNAIREGSSEYIVLLNPDTFVMKGFFDDCVRFMQENPEVGIMGPRILDHDGRLQNSARAFPTPLTAFFGRSSFLSRRFPKNPITSRNLLSLKSDGKSPMEVDWVSGACMIVRRKAVEAVGLLDERFFMYWEDTDWCQRMRNAGWRVVYYPKPYIYHYVGGSSEKTIIRSVIEFHKSVYLLFDKYFESSFFFMKPIVFGGLTIRLIFVLFSQLLQHLFSFFSVDNGQMTYQRSKLPRKIKVLVVISRLNIGGPAIHVYILTNGLDPKKFESKLVTGKISPQEGDMSYLFGKNDKKPIIIPELQREISLKLDLKAFSRIFKILVKEKPDIVHTHTAKAGFTTRFAVFLYNLFRKEKIQVVHTFHGHVFEGYFTKINTMMFVNIERLLARTTDAIIAISKSQKDELAYKYGIAPAEKIKTIELGFNLKPFVVENSARGVFKKKLGLPDNVLLIGIIGRLVPIKNHKMFFDAAKLFFQQNPDALVKFIVVGDGELREELEAYCQYQGLNDGVIFCGWVKNVHYVYTDLDILALTSLNEGTPVSIIESMAYSVPVIATDVGGVQDLLGIPDGHSSDGFVVCERGVLCKKNDVDGFANGLKYLVEIDDAKIEKTVRSARFFVEKKFSYDRFFQDIESLYTDLAYRKYPKAKHADSSPAV